MKKTLLKEIAENYIEKAKERPYIWGYSRKEQYKTAEIASAIINTICTFDGISNCRAKEALKMAEEIMEHSSEADIIS